MTTVHCMSSFVLSLMALSSLAPLKGSWSLSTRAVWPRTPAAKKGRGLHTQFFNQDFWLNRISASTPATLSLETTANICYLIRFAIFVFEVLMVAINNTTNANEERNSCQQVMASIPLLKSELLSARLSDEWPVVSSIELCFTITLKIFLPPMKATVTQTIPAESSKSTGGTRRCALLGSPGQGKSK